MVLEIRDTGFQLIGILDIYKSLIWTQRYRRYGDCELVLYPTTELIQLLKPNYYLSLQDDLNGGFMIIEQLDLKNDPIDGNLLTVKGRSLESILCRRVLWPAFTKTGKPDVYLRELVKDYFASNSFFGRSFLPIYTSFDESFKNAGFMSETITSQHTGDYMYDVICELADIYGFGFKMDVKFLATPAAGGYRWAIITTFYNGEDRAYGQTKNPTVIFSPKFNNIGSTEDYQSIADYSNTAYIAGEQEGLARRWSSITSDSNGNSMLFRREIFVDARDIQSTYRDSDGEEHRIPDAEYKTMLDDRGFEKLSSCSKIHEYDGNIDYSVQYEFGRDYFLGDIVQIEDEFGTERLGRVEEVIRSDGDDGFHIYPTLSLYEKESD